MIVDLDVISAAIEKGSREALAEIEAQLRQHVAERLDRIEQRLAALEMSEASRHGRQ